MTVNDNDARNVIIRVYIYTLGLLHIKRKTTSLPPLYISSSYIITSLPPKKYSYHATIWFQKKPSNARQHSIAVAKSKASLW